LKKTLAATYTDEEQACVVADGSPATSPIDRITRAADVKLLIARIDDSAPFSQMRPVGY
jgi:hypothetical protein